MEEWYTIIEECSRIEHERIENGVDNEHQMQRWLQVVGDLLSVADLDVHVRGSKGLTPFHLATDAGLHRLADVLLDFGANVDARDKNGMTALHYACLCCELETIRYLLIKNADVRAKDNKFGRTPVLWLLHQISVAVTTPKHLAAAKLLIENGADVTCADRDGYTALHRACIGSHFEMVKLLMENASNVHAAGLFGATPLHLACIENHMEIVKWLIEHGADQNIQDSEGMSSLHRACWMGNLEVVQLLLLLSQGANVTCKTPDGMTPLHFACQQNHPKLVFWLLRKYSILLEETTDEELCAEIVRLKNEKKVLQVENACLKHEQEKLRAENAQLKRERNERDAQIKQLKEELKQAKQHVDFWSGMARQD